MTITTIMAGSSVLTLEELLTLEAAPDPEPQFVNLNDQQRAEHIARFAEFRRSMGCGRKDPGPWPKRVSVRAVVQKELRNRKRRPDLFKTDFRPRYIVGTVTEAELTRAVGCSQSMMSKILKGTRLPSLVILQQMAIYLSGAMGERFYMEDVLDLLALRPWKK